MATKTEKNVEEKVENQVVEETPVTEETPVVEEDTASEQVEEKKPVAETHVAVVSDDNDLGLGFSLDELAELSGLNNIDSSEITIPYANLLQKDISKDEKKGYLIFPDGTFLKGFDGEIEEDIAILNIMKVRSYFPSPFKANNTYICRSLDGKTGADDGVSQYPGQSCATCEFAKYPEEGGSSPCRDQRLLLCARKNGSLFHFQISGIGMAEWRKFLSSQLLHLLPKVKKVYGGEILGAIRINLGVKETDTEYGIFANPDFNVNKENPFHEKEHLVNILKTYQGYKAFEVENIKTAAAQTRFQMATGEAEATGSGENGDMF